MPGLLRDFAERENLKIQVWQKGKPIKGRDADEWRQDHKGNRIRFSDHGNRDSEFGWEIDHIVPESQGGSDDLDNLRPLQWRENLARRIYSNTQHS